MKNLFYPVIRVTPFLESVTSKMMAQQAYLPVPPAVQFGPGDMTAVQPFTHNRPQFDFHSFQQGMAPAYSLHASQPQPQHHPAWTHQLLQPRQRHHLSYKEARLRKLEERREANRLSAKRSKMKQKAKFEETVSTAVACHRHNNIIRAQIQDCHHDLKKINDQNNQFRKELNQAVSNDIPEEPNLPPRVLLPDRIIYRMDKAKEDDFIQEVLLSNNTTPPSKCIEQLETEFRIRHLAGFEKKN